MDQKRRPAYCSNQAVTQNLILTMEDFLKFLIEPLLSEPKDLKITHQGSAIIIKVADADVGRIIGKHGVVISALRTLLRTFCTAQNIPFVTLTLDTPPVPVKKD